MARLNEFFFITLNQFPGAALEVYTFGEPRSGNEDYVNFLNSQRVTTARITNKYVHTKGVAELRV